VYTYNVHPPYGPCTPPYTAQAQRTQHMRYTGGRKHVGTLHQHTRKGSVIKGLIDCDNCYGISCHYK